MSLCSTQIKLVNEGHQPKGLADFGKNKKENWLCLWSQLEWESDLEKPAMFRMVSLVLLTMSPSGNLLLTPVYILFRTYLLEDYGYRLSSGTLGSLEVTLFAGLWEVLGLEILGRHRFSRKIDPKIQRGEGLCEVCFTIQEQDG